MAKKENTDKDTTLLGKFDALKKKHPDAMLLFRNGDFYELYREDAVKASVLLALKISEKINSRRERACQAGRVSPSCPGHVSAQTDPFGAKGRHL